MCFVFDHSAFFNFSARPTLCLFWLVLMTFIRQRRSSGVPLQPPHSSSMEPRRCCDQTVAPELCTGYQSARTGACPLIVCVSTFGPDNWSTAGEARGVSRVSLVIDLARVYHSAGLSLSETTLARFVWRACSSASTPDRTYISSTFSRARRRRGRSARV